MSAVFFFQQKLHDDARFHCQMDGSVAINFAEEKREEKRRGRKHKRESLGVR